MTLKWKLRDYIDQFKSWEANLTLTIKLRDKNDYFDIQILNSLYATINDCGDPHHRHSDGMWGITRFFLAYKK